MKGDFVYAYSFLSLDQVIVAAGETRLSGLQVISLSTSSQSASLTVEDMAKIEYGYFLRFPGVSGVQRVWHVGIRSGPLPSIHRTSAPFFVDTDKRMFLLTVSDPHYGVYDSLSIIISGEQLLKAINNTTVESQRDIRWKDWGLTGCFFSSILEGHDHTWLCNVYGTRLINLWDPGLPEFYILDCSKYGHPSLDTDISSEEDNNRERMFEGLAHANSPGLSFTQHGPLAVSGKLGVCDAVMMSEDNIVFVDSVSSISLVDIFLITTDFHVIERVHNEVLYYEFVARPSISWSISLEVTIAYCYNISEHEYVISSLQETPFYLMQWTEISHRRSSVSL